MSDPYAKAAADRRYGGTVLVDGKEVACTIQCVHCGDHAVLLRNVAGDLCTGGWCSRCNGFICGRKCLSCKPFERWLEEVEGTKQSGSVSVAVNVNGGVDG